ncbi:hypothetical protein TorRG33x02_041990, partial [Trema orientale]
MLINNSIKLHSHMVIHIAKAFGGKPEISSLAPNQKIQSNVQQLPAVVAVPAAVDQDAGLPAEVGAPEAVVLEQLPGESPEHGGLELVGDGRRRVEPHLGVGQVKNQVLPLVPDVVVLEAEEDAEPVHEVVAGAPGHERRPGEVPDGPQGGGGGAHLGVPQRRVVGE